MSASKPTSIVEEPEALFAADGTVDAQDWLVSAPHELHTVESDLPRHVERALHEYLDSRRAEAEAMEEAFASAVDALGGFVLGGGKRIRPTFAWWGWRAAGGDPESEHVPAVLRAISALELLQGCALVHDDLIDASAVRRGAPTIHVAFAERHREHHWLGQSERFGLAAAVLLGDVALAWADDMLNTSGLPVDALRRAQTPWRAMRTEMLAGQYLDVLTQATGDESPSAALRVSQLKTAAYTIERPLHLGGTIADGSTETLAALRAFGADIGVAFQLRDDRLGVFGDPDTTGKPAGDDLREGKRTLLMALALRYAGERRDSAAGSVLRNALGRPDLDQATLAAVRTLLTDLGAVRAVEDQIAQLTDSALATLDSAGLPGDAARALTELAVTATRRSH